MILNEKDRQHGRTPLQYAVQNRHEDIVRLLAMAKEVDIDAQNNKRDTAIHIALRLGTEYLQVAQILYSPGMANLRIKNDDGVSAKSLAKQLGVNLKKMSLVSSASKKSSKPSKRGWHTLFGGIRIKKMRKNFNHLRHGSAPNADIGEGDGKGVALNKKQILESSMKSSWRSTRKTIEMRTTELEKSRASTSNEGDNCQFVVWDESCKWNVAQFNEPYKTFADIINTLYKIVMMTLVDPVSLLYVLGSLREFTALDTGVFAVEERLMHEYAMPSDQINEHVEDHSEFRAKMKHFEDHTDIAHGGSKHIQMELLNFLVEYWQNHVMVKDRDLIAWIQKAQRQEQESKDQS